MSTAPWPVPDGDTQEYWDAVSDRRFVIQRCRRCGTHQYYPRAVCTTCSSLEVELVAATGRGIVYSYTVSRRAAHPDLADLVPYVVALIDLEEGPRMLANVVGADAEQVSIGAAVAVTFFKPAEGVNLPGFEIIGREPIRNAIEEEEER